MGRELLANLRPKLVQLQERINVQACQQRDTAEQDDRYEGGLAFAGIGGRAARSGCVLFGHDEGLLMRLGLPFAILLP